MSRLIVMLLLMTGAAAAADRPVFDPHIGAKLGLDQVLMDSDGGHVSLADTLDGRPALVVFGYDKCPNLCGVTQRAVAADLKKTGLDPDSYRALFVSIDPTETADDAAFTKAELNEVTDDRGLSAWRFLTDSDGGGAALAKQAGIAFDTRERIGQFVHPIAVIALTPKAVIAQVLPALSFEPRDLRLALVEASAGKLGSIADQVFLLCAGFDSSKGQYTPVIRVVLKLAGIATMLLLGLAVLLLSRRRTG